jgi:hypothetical protein
MILYLGPQACSYCFLICCLGFPSSVNIKQGLNGKPGRSGHSRRLQPPGGIRQRKVSTPLPQGQVGTPSVNERRGLPLRDRQAETIIRSRNCQLSCCIAKRLRGIVPLDFLLLFSWDPALIHGLKSFS